MLFLLQPQTSSLAGLSSTDSALTEADNTGISVVFRDVVTEIERDASRSPGSGENLAQLEENGNELPSGGKDLPSQPLNFGDDPYTPLPDQGVSWFAIHPGEMIATQPQEADRRGAPAAPLSVEPGRPGRGGFSPESLRPVVAPGNSISGSQDRSENGPGSQPHRETPTLLSLAEHRLTSLSDARRTDPDALSHRDAPGGAVAHQLRSGLLSGANSGIAFVPRIAPTVIAVATDLQAGSYPTESLPGVELQRQQSPIHSVVPPGPGSAVFRALTELAPQPSSRDAAALQGPGLSGASMTNPQLDSNRRALIANEAGVSRSGFPDRLVRPTPAIGTSSLANGLNAPSLATSGEAPPSHRVAIDPIGELQAAISPASADNSVQRDSASSANLDLRARLTDLPGAYRETAPTAPVAGLAHGQSPAGPAAAMPASSVSQALASPLAADDPEFSLKAGERVMIMSQANVQRAEIRLSPQNMGPITIEIDYNEKGANIQFTAANAQVRDSLEQALPKLREMFENGGLRLGEAAVGSRGQERSTGSSGENHAEDHSENMHTRSDVESEVTPQVLPDITNPITRGRIDTFV